MPTNLWGDFAGLAQGSPRLLATVTSHNPDGTSSLTSLDGQGMRAWGKVAELSPPYNAFVRDGKVEGPAPNLPLVELTV